jgi:hypothetical protein
MQVFEPLVGEGCEIALHDLHVVDVVLEEQVVVSRPSVDECRSGLVLVVVRKKPGNVDGVDRLDQQLDAGIAFSFGAAYFRLSTKRVLPARC